MDISSLYGSSALDSTAYTNAAKQTASKLQDKLNSSDYSKATDDELMDACKQFESSICDIDPSTNVRHPAICFINYLCILQGTLRIYRFRWLLLSWDPQLSWY